MINSNMNYMSKLFFLATLTITFSIQSDDRISPYCPVLDLNPTTRHFYEKSVSRLLAESEYTDQLASLGIHQPILIDDLVLLNAADHSAVCQKLNEQFNDKSHDKVYDHELDRYMPSTFFSYYELQNRYLVFRQFYESGSDVEGIIGPPSIGSRNVFIFDKKNLNYLGVISF